MTPAPRPLTPPPRKVALPNSSTRTDRGIAHVKLLHDVRPDVPYNLGWDGDLHAPGALLDWEELPDPAVVLECAGAMGKARRGKKREYLWILWRYDRALSEWKEIGRAAALNWEWSMALRQPAIRALHPQPELVDVLALGRELGEDIMRSIDQRLALVPPEVRVNILTAVYDQVAGRIANE